MGEDYREETQGREHEASGAESRTVEACEVGTAEGVDEAGETGSAAPVEVIAPVGSVEKVDAIGVGVSAGAPRKLSRRGFVAMAGLAAASAALAACSGSDDGATDSDGGSTTSDDDDENEEHSIVNFLFDTVIEIQAMCSSELLAEVNERLEYFESIFSRTIEGSDIWNINEAGGEAVEVAEETADIILKSIEYSEESDGLFDITIGTVSELWDFDEGVKPSDDEITEALKHIGYGSISVAGTTVQLSDSKTKLDLGGIAKGYICDDIVEMLREGGCEYASISLGGNIYVLGLSSDGDAWNVGIQDPNGTYSDSIASIECEDKSVVTSGLYERYFELDGVMYYHILDPKTGYPVVTDLESASIVSDYSVDGDSYATMLFLMGHDAALEWLNARSDFQGLLIDSSDQITTSDGSDFVLF